VYDYFVILKNNLLDNFQNLLVRLDFELIKNNKYFIFIVSKSVINYGLKLNKS